MSANAVPVYDWVTHPPVVFVEWGEIEERVSAFHTSLANWGVMGGDTPLAGRINAHQGGANFIAGLIVSQNHQPYTPVFEYRVVGQPIALLQFDMQGSDGMLVIKNLATHPGTEGAGGIMVEYALNKITSYNAQMRQHAQTDMFEPGCLFLKSYDDHSTAAYLALGFDIVGGREMVLDATASPKWGQVDGKWRLVGKPPRYLTSV
jgi:hypothetical protein